jgi:membrane protease YdiL (CAAX protease family)
MVQVFDLTFNGIGEPFKRTFKALMIALVLVLVASYFLAMLLGVELFFFTLEGRALSIRHIFLFVWSVYILCFGIAWIWRESFHKVIGNAFLRPVSQLLRNFLFALPILASMLLLAVIGIHYFQESALGVPTGEPILPENPFETFFLLAYSPLIEEIAFRLSPIGLFLIVYVFWAGRMVVAQLSSRHLLKLFLVAPIYPEEAKRMVGLKNVGVNGFRGISVGEWIMVLATSLVFGLAHLLSPIGWDVGKVTSTFMVGFVWGLAYLAYGFQAPILLHWYFNYYFYAYELASDLYPSTFSIEVLISFLTIIVGILGLLALLAMGLSRISCRKQVKGREPSSISLS